MNFLGAQKTSGSPPATQLRIQTSVAGQPITKGWGRTRVAGNLIWYGDFSQTTNSSGGKGGSGGKNGGNTTYQASVIIGIADGPIAGFTGVIWTNETSGHLSDLNFATFNGDQSQTTWSYMASVPGGTGDTPAPIDTWVEVTNGPEGGGGSGG